MARTRRTTASGSAKLVFPDDFRPDFEGFRPAAFTFLRGLARHNERDWFAAFAPLRPPRHDWQKLNEPPMAVKRNRSPGLARNPPPGDVRADADRHKLSKMLAKLNQKVMIFCHVGRLA